MADQSFPAHLRLRRRSDFDRVIRRRCTAADDWLLLFGCPNELGHPRFGFIVAGKWGPAHVRNRVRRLYREACRLGKEQFPSGIDYVLMPRRVDDLRLGQLLASLPRLARSVAGRLAASSQRRPAQPSGPDCQ